MRRPTRLQRQLLRLGHHASLSADAGRVRFWGLFLSAVLLTLGLCALVLAHATYEGRELRGAARGPQPIVDESTQEAVALWAWDTDDVDGRQHALVYIEPLNHDADPPAGLAAWPEPGEAVLSPALLAAGADEGMATRYGRLAGTITEEGLESPAERFAYVRPRASLLDEEEMYPVAGFGGPHAALAVGEHLFIPDLSTMAAGIAGFVLLPAGALLVASARTGSAARERRMLVFDALGADRSARSVFAVGEAAVPALLGTLVGAVALSPAYMVNLDFPGVDFTLSTHDARRAAPLLAGAAVLALLSVIAAAALLHPRGGAPTGTRLGARPQRHRRGWPWLFPFAVLFAVRVPDLIGGTLRLPVYALGLAVVLATLPSFVAALTTALGERLAQTGARLGRPGMLVAGRRIAAHPRVTSRFVAALVVMIGLASQAQLWTGLLGDNATEAAEARDRVGTSLLTISAYPADARIDAFEAALADNIPDAAPLALRETPTGATTLMGPCAALTALALPCDAAGVTVRAGDGDARVEELLGWTAAGTDGSLIARQGAVTGAVAGPDVARSLVVVSRSGNDLPLAALKETARTHLSMDASAEPLGHEWLLGANDLAASAAWVRLLGLVGAALTVLAIGLGAMAEFVRLGRDLAPLATIAGNTGIHGSVVAWSLLLPALAAVLLGSMTALWLTAPITNATGHGLSWTFFVTLATGAAATALALCAWGWRVTAGSATTWRPIAAD